MSLTPTVPAPAAETPTAAPTTRREFAATLALATLGACVPRAATTTPAVPAAPAAPPATPAVPPASPARAPDPVAVALVGVVTARYGADVVPDAQRAAFDDAVGRTLELSRRLRQTPVANGVDPFSSLCPMPAAAARRAP